MDLSSTMIEFGDFEVKLQQIYKHHECVELPTSWPPEDSHQLSFCFPEDIVGVDKPTDPVQDAAIVKSNDASLTELPSNTPLCNGGGENINDTSVVNGKISKEEVICKEESLKILEKRLEKRQAVNSVSVNKQIIRRKSSSGNENDNANKQVPSKDTITYSEINNNKKSSAHIDMNGTPDPQNLKPAENLTNAINVDSTNQRTTNTKLSTSEKHSPDSNITFSQKSEQTKQATPKQVTSWAGLFRGSTNTNGSSETTAPAPKQKQLPVRKNNNAQDNTSVTEPDKRKSDTNNAKSVRNGSAAKSSLCLVKPSEDPNAKGVAEELHNMELIFKPQAFIPRGLTNTSNWCYINATLQALLVCPPFYQFLKSISTFTPLSQKTVTCSPIIDSFLQLASEFRPLSTKRGFVTKEVRHGPPFEPRYIYDMLTLIKSSLSEKGRQEDAEEFQSCVLNGLHEEMTQLFAYLNDSANSQSPESRSEQDDSSSTSEELMNGDAEKEEWEEVMATKKNKSAVTRRADDTRTPISDMFRGELCTSVFRPGQKVSVSYEPFFSLPLSVPADHACNVDDALMSLTDKESFLADGEGQSDASRQQTLESLPPIFILHLKRFVYDKSGGLKKIDKKVEYKTDMVIGKEMLSKSARKLSLNQRTYKLFAVVYHHGEKATGGHYTTDVFHIGLSSWLRIDDQNIKTVHHTEVTRHNPSRTAYLLYYRRIDLG
ncbi:ubiquitin carboxyl-terminal hydrolase 10-like [Ciona intestinalis]